MTLTLTIIDDTYSRNGADGVKRVQFTGSFTNPYTAGGESVTTSTYFGTKFLGGTVLAVEPSVGIDNTGIAMTGRFRSDTSSTTTAVLQLFNAGLSGTAKAGLFVDNTVANISNTTITFEMAGY